MHTLFFLIYIYKYYIYIYTCFTICAIYFPQLDLLAQLDSISNSWSIC